MISLRIITSTYIKNMFIEGNVYIQKTFKISNAFYAKFNVKNWFKFYTVDAEFKTL